MHSRFRWANCQLDILGKLKSEYAINEALKRLPKTLDETYERILTSIPEENFTIAHKALQWLSFNERIETLEALADAIAIDTEQCSYNPEHQLLHPEDLLEICSCLIEASDHLYRKGRGVKL